MSEDKHTRTVLEDGVEDLTRVVEGVAGLLFGRQAPAATDDTHETDDTEAEESTGGPVISEDVDRAIQDLGSAVGQVLLAAGDHLQRGAGENVEDEDDSATPLVHGARSLGRGLGALAGELLGSLQSAAASASTSASSADSKPADDPA